MPIQVKRNDRAPFVRATLFDEDDVAVNLTGASVRFVMKTTEAAPTEKVNAPMTLVNAAGGIVEYQWAVGDTDTAGSFVAEFEVTYASGVPQTFPTNGFETVTIYPDLGGSA